MNQNNEIDQLRHYARVMVRELGLLKDEYFHVGVTLPMRHLLIELSHSVFPTINEMAEKLLLDKSSVSRLIKRATQKGYVQIKLDPIDKRKRFLEMTEKGRETMNAFETIAHQQVFKALETLKEEEVETVKKGIRLFALGLNRSRQCEEVTIRQVKAQDDLVLAKKVAVLNSQDPHLTNISKSYRKKGWGYIVMLKGNQIVAGMGFCPSYQKGRCEIKHGFLVNQDLPTDRLLKQCLEEVVKSGYTVCQLNVDQVDSNIIDLAIQFDFKPASKNSSLIIKKVGKYENEIRPSKRFRQT